MISNPTPQRALRAPKPATPNPRAANSAEHQARLASRLTARDKWIAHLLHEHRVLTSHQLTTLAFPSYRSARQRLRELYLWSVLDRFQPIARTGTAPMHYVLGPAGATVLAAEHGLDPKDLGYRHDRALAVAHSLQLAHTIGVNEWFTALAATAHRSAGSAALTAWWSETRCARHFGDLVRPDAYGRWNNGGNQVEFFLEYDFGTEKLAHVASKLHGYAALAHATGITTPVLVWLQTSRREAAARQLITRTWQSLDHPDTVPVATASAELLNPDDRASSPAGPIWLPIDGLSEGRERRVLRQLDPSRAQSRRPTVSIDRPDSDGRARQAELPAPDPMAGQAGQTSIQ